jgi:uncharacterized protein with FMN-binding domain
MSRNQIILVGGVFIVVVVLVFFITNEFLLKKPDSINGTVQTQTTPSTEATTTPSVTTETITPSMNSTTGEFKDGTYKATGSYTSPAGTESVEVSLTVKNDVIESVQVTPKASHPTSRNYQALFSQGISQKVVGKKLSEVQNVGRVNGSSLTTNGFANAISAIKEQAN